MERKKLSIVENVDIVGLTVNEALGKLGKGAHIRIVEKDGEGFIVTLELNPERINVKIEKDIITEVVSRG